MKSSPLAAAILYHLVTERGSIYVETLECDVALLPWFAEFKAGEAEIEAALSALIAAGKVKRWTEGNQAVVEAVPEAEWPENNKPKQLAMFG